jgi:hypothetical protein
MNLESMDLVRRLVRGRAYFFALAAASDIACMRS